MRGLAPLPVQTNVVRICSALDRDHFGGFAFQLPELPNYGSINEDVVEMEEVPTKKVVRKWVLYLLFFETIGTAVHSPN